MHGGAILHRFTRRLVPKRFRRAPSFGLSVGQKGRHRLLPGAPARSIGEKGAANPRPACVKCGCREWRHTQTRRRPGTARQPARIAQPFVAEGLEGFSLVPRIRAEKAAGPDRTPVQQDDSSTPLHAHAEFDLPIRPGCF